MIKIENYKSFANLEVDLTSVSIINILIGKNNSGKSSYIDMIGAFSDFQVFQGFSKKCDIFFDGVIESEDDVKLIVQCAGKRFPVGTKYEYYLNGGNFNDAKFCVFDSDRQLRMDFKSQNNKPPLPLRDYKVYKLSAERDVKQESLHENSTFRADGSNATNIIREAKISSENKKLRKIIDTLMVDSFNQILGGELAIKSIEARTVGPANNNRWEIFLKDDNEDEVSLSDSGSGLRSIVLALMNLMLLPAKDGVDLCACVFLMEELENNLHPSVQRRLFKFIFDYCEKHGCKLFLSTHSAISIDLAFGRNAKIIKIDKTDKKSVREDLAKWEDVFGLVGHLGSRPSDLLYGSCVVWVEGPSDRIYIKHWISLLAPDLEEGREYVLAFYGGALSANTEFSAAQSSQAGGLVNLLRINHNVIFIADSDKKEETHELKSRIKRINDEVSKVGGHCWITGRKEIENYIPVSILRQIYDSDRDVPEIGKFEVFHADNSLNTSGAGYLQKHFNRSHFNKVDLAEKVTAIYKNEDFITFPDLKDAMFSIIEKIKLWNKI